jgi:hypothetical protein
MRVWKRPSARSIAFQAFGVAAEVQFGDRALEADVIEILPPGWSATDAAAVKVRFSLEAGQANSFDVTINGRVAIEQATLDVALGFLDAEIRMLIATSTTDWIFVHAGVVALRGRALVLPGESFSGKTTLVRSLVEIGATYYSDEYAVLDHDGMVHPYPRRLSIRSANGFAGAEHHVGEFGGVAGDASAVVDTVAITQYRPGADWKPARVSAGEGMLAMLANTVPAQQRPGESMRALARALRDTHVLAGDRGEASEAARALITELRSSRT